MIQQEGIGPNGGSMAPGGCYAEAPGTVRTGRWSATWRGRSLLRLFSYCGTPSRLAQLRACVDAEQVNEQEGS